MVTLKQIAETVGVSTATVSRVLNFDNTLSISEAKRLAIIEAAEALNYETPRARNRSVSPGLNKIALAHFLRPDQELTDPYYVGMRLGIEKKCQAHKIEVVKVYRTGDLPDPSLLKSANGTIVIGRHTAEETAWLKRCSKHVVFADFEPDEPDEDCVRCDLEGAMRKILHLLAQADYQRVGFVGWHIGARKWRNSQSDLRFRAYAEWMKQHDKFDEAICKFGENSAESGHLLTREILALPSRPDAIVTANDNMAVGAYRAIAELKLKIPQDIAIASFNDVSVAQFLNPPLSTMRLPSEEIGETAVELLLERIAGRSLPKRITLGTEMKMRGSARLRAH